MMKARTSQSAECLRKPWGPFSAKFKATANELDQGRILLMYYEDILFSGNRHKIC